MTLLNFISPPSDSLTNQFIQRSSENVNNFYSLIKQGRFEELFDTLINWSISFGGKLIIGILIFFVGRWIILKILKGQEKIFEKRGMDVALKGFLKSATKILLYILLILFIINIVGAKAVSLAALIASAGLAIGLAVKDNLANFAGGVMLLFSKPFKGGDYIEAQGLAGTVQTVGILYTTLTTPDNKTVYIPNGPLSTDNIVNYNSQINRRIDITVGVEYGSNVELVKKLLLEIAQNHPQTLKDPAPFARMTKMNSSSIDFTLRTWTEAADYWDVTFDLNEEIYRKMNENDLVIPFPQLTVHMAQENTKEEEKRNATRKP